MKFGANPAWAQGRHVDAAAVELDREPLGERGDPRLDRRVVTHRDETGSARHIQDRARAPWQHPAGGRAGQHEYRATHHLERPVVRRYVGVGQLGVYSEASVVDEKIDGSSRVFEARSDASHIGSIGEIRRENFNRATHRANFGRHLGQPLLRAGNKHQIVTAGSKLSRERGTDARRSPGDESYTHGTYDTVLGGNPAILRRQLDGSKGLIS